MIQITSTKKGRTCQSEIEIHNTNPEEMLSVLDVAIDCLVEHGVSEIAIIDYVINRDGYRDSERSED